jgi:hypothetical protein
MKVRLTGSKFGDDIGRVVEGKPNPAVPGLFNVNLNDRLFGGCVVALEDGADEIFTKEAWGGEIVPEPKPTKVYKILMHQSVTRVHHVRAVSPEHAVTLAWGGDAGFPVDESHSRWEIQVLS